MMIKDVSKVNVESGSRRIKKQNGGKEIKELKRKYYCGSLSATDLNPNFAHIHVSNGDFMGKFNANDLKELIDDLKKVYEIIKIDN